MRASVPPTLRRRIYRCRERRKGRCARPDGVARCQAAFLAVGNFQAVPLLCRADEVHAFRGIAPLNPGDAESVVIRRLFVHKDGDKVSAEALK